MNISDGEYPIHEGDLRNICKNLGKEFPFSEEYIPVYDIDPPENVFELEETMVEAQPVNVDGRFIRSFTFVKRVPVFKGPEFKKPMDVKKYKASSVKPIFPTEATGRIGMSIIQSNT